MHRVKKGEVYDAVPGGTVEAGESPEETGVREIQEETSMEVTLGRRVLVLSNQGRQEHYFDAVTVTGDPVLGGPEALRNSPENLYELAWVPLGEVASRPFPLGQFLSASEFRS